MPRIVLHQWEISPYCHKVRLLLKHKGLSFDVVEYSGLKALGVGRLSSAGKLPVLDYDGEMIQDSSAIARFLEQRHPQPALFPADPREAHLTHILEDWADESLYWYEVYFRAMYPEALRQAFEIVQRGRPAWELPVMLKAAGLALRHKVREQGLGKYDRETVTAQFLAHLAHLDGMLAQQAWLAGGAGISIADIAVAAQLAEVRRTSHLAARYAEFPALSAWLQRVL